MKELRANGEFPMVIWKDTPPQHFATTFGEYPQDKPKPPFVCEPIGKNYGPKKGADKWRLNDDHTVEALFPEYGTIAEGGWRNKVCTELPHKHLISHAHGGVHRAPQSHTRLDGRA